MRPAAIRASLAREPFTAHSQGAFKLTGEKCRLLAFKPPAETDISPGDELLTPEFSCTSYRPSVRGHRPTKPPIRTLSDAPRGELIKAPRFSPWRKQGEPAIFSADTPATAGEIRAGESAK